MARSFLGGTRRGNSLKPTGVYGGFGRGWGRLGNGRPSERRRAEDDAAQGDDRRAERGGAEELGRRPGSRAWNRPTGRRRRKTPPPPAKWPNRSECGSTSVLFGWGNMNGGDRGTGRQRGEDGNRAAGRARLRRRHRAVRPLPDRRNARAEALGVRHPLRRKDRPPEAGCRRRQRQVSEVHRGPRPCRRYVAGRHQAADPDGGEDGRGHRGRKRVEQPVGEAGSVCQLRRLVRQPLGQGLLRHRQSRASTPRRKMDPHARQADREVPRQGLQARSQTAATAASSATSARGASIGPRSARPWTKSATTVG